MSSININFEKFIKCLSKTPPAFTDFISVKASFEDDVIHLNSNKQLSFCKEKISRVTLPFNSFMVKVQEFTFCDVCLSKTFSYRTWLQEHTLFTSLKSRMFEIIPHLHSYFFEEDDLGSLIDFETYLATLTGKRTIFGANFANRSGSKLTPGSETDIYNNLYDGVASLLSSEREKLKVSWVEKFNDLILTVLLNDEAFKSDVLKTLKDTVKVLNHSLTRKNEFASKHDFEVLMTEFFNSVFKQFYVQGDFREGFSVEYVKSVKTSKSAFAAFFSKEDYEIIINALKNVILKHVVINSDFGNSFSLVEVVRNGRPKVIKSAMTYGYWRETYKFVNNPGGSYLYHYFNNIFFEEHKGSAYWYCPSFLAKWLKASRDILDINDNFMQGALPDLPFDEVLSIKETALSLWDKNSDTIFNNLSKCVEIASEV